MHYLTADPNDYVFVLGRVGASAAAFLLQQVRAATLTTTNFNTSIKSNLTAVTFSPAQSWTISCGTPNTMQFVTLLQGGLLLPPRSLLKAAVSGGEGREGAEAANAVSGEPWTTSS
jgi:hypothetical protein